jgi:hypothetical protein
VVQRATAPKEPTLPVVPALDTPAPAPVQSGPLALGAATPPPIEQTVPPPYVTPGLPSADANAVDEGPDAPVHAPVHAPPPPPVRLPPIFSAKGAVYGAPASANAAVLQAGRPASLIVRGPTGAVHFARQLAAGEAYRAPLGQALQLEVTDPGAFGFYIGNSLRGTLVVPVTPLDRAAAESAPPPAAAVKPLVPAAVVPIAPKPAAPAAARPPAPAPAAEAEPAQP